MAKLNRAELAEHTGYLLRVHPHRILDKYDLVRNACILARLDPFTEWKTIAPHPAALIHLEVAEVLSSTTPGFSVLKENLGPRQLTFDYSKNDC